MSTTPRPYPAIGLLHAGLTASFYVGLREELIWPWFWPFDETVWLLAVMVILAGWRWIFPSIGPFGRAAVIAGVTDVIVGVIFPLGLYIASLQLTPNDSSVAPDYRASEIIAGVFLMWILVMPFLIAATLVAGAIAAALWKWGGRLFGPALPRLACSLGIVGIILPFAAAWAHASLGLGLADIGRCSKRLPDLSIFDLAKLWPKTIVIGHWVDCGHPTP